MHERAPAPAKRRARLAALLLGVLGRQRRFHSEVGQRTTVAWRSVRMDLKAVNPSHDRHVGLQRRVVLQPHHLYRGLLLQDLSATECQYLK